MHESLSRAVKEESVKRQETEAWQQQIAQLLPCREKLSELETFRTVQQQCKLEETELKNIRLQLQQEKDTYKRLQSDIADFRNKNLLMQKLDRARQEVSRLNKLADSQENILDQLDHLLAQENSTAKQLQELHYSLMLSALESKAAVVQRCRLAATSDHPSSKSGEFELVAGIELLRSQIQRRN